MAGLSPKSFSFPTWHQRVGYWPGIHVENPRDNDRLSCGCGPLCTRLFPPVINKIAREKQAKRERHGGKSWYRVSGPDQPCLTDNLRLRSHMLSAIRAVSTEEDDEDDDEDDDDCSKTNKYAAGLS